MNGEKTDGKETRLCSVCGEKPTISSNSPYCGSCMARKGNEKRRQNVLIAAENNDAKETKEAKNLTVKTQLCGNNEVVIDFTDHPSVLQQVKELAADQIRPVELQIIYLLKICFEGLNQGGENVK